MEGGGWRSGDGGVEGVQGKGCVVGGWRVEGWRDGGVGGGWSGRRVEGGGWRR